METLKLNKIVVVGDDSLYVNEIVRNLKKEGFLEVEAFTNNCDFEDCLRQHHNVCVIIQGDALPRDVMERITSMQEVAYLVVISSKLSKESVTALKETVFEHIAQDDKSMDELMNTMHKIWILEELSEQKQERRHTLQAGATLLVSVLLVVAMALFLNK